MKVAVVYFSGTGNTEAIAQGYQEAMTQAGHDVSLASIEQMEGIPEHDLLIVGGPIYGGSMPDILIQWVRKTVPKTMTGKKAIVFSTSAGFVNAKGVKSIGKKLNKKGYSLVDMPTYEMPRNFYMDKYQPTPESDQIRQFAEASVGILKSINRVDSTAEIKISESVVMSDLMADVFRLLAQSLGKSFHINNNCIGCGKCQANCPESNIDYIKKEYSNRCRMCTRCIHNCPVNAISYKGKFIQQYQVHYEISI